MNAETMRALVDLNNRFYAEHASSFSATRTTPWEGWRRLAELLRAHGWGAGEASSTQIVLDVACGNLRFEQFFGETFPSTALEFHAVDSCRPLVDSAHDDVSYQPCIDGVCNSDSYRPSVDDARNDARPLANSGDRIVFHEYDVLGAILDQAEFISRGAQEGTPNQVSALTRDARRGRLGHTSISACTAAYGLCTQMNTPASDLTVSFGFFHHIPSVALRETLLNLLIDRTLPGGYIALSFWQFMHDERLARKVHFADQAARENPPFLSFDAAALDENDHFLGWQHDPAPLRYCHHFPEEEIDELVASVSDAAREVARFSADGSSGTLNRYLVLERA